MIHQIDSFWQCVHVLSWINTWKCYKVVRIWTIRKYLESTGSMMDVILPCFDICHMLSVYTHTLTNGIYWYVFYIVFFSSFFPSYQYYYCASITLYLQTHEEQSISEAFTCTHCYVCSSKCDKISSLPVFYVNEKFTHQVIYLNTKSSIFYVKVKIYTSSLLHCYQLSIF